MHKYKVYYQGAFIPLPILESHLPILEFTKSLASTGFLDNERWIMPGAIFWVEQVVSKKDCLECKKAKTRATCPTHQD